MKSTWKSVRRLGAALLLGVLGAQAQAATISLADLVAGETITAGDKTFSGWSLIDTLVSNDNLLPDLNNIFVTSLDDGGLDPGPGLSFDFGDELTVTGDDVYAFIDLWFGFWVEPAAGLAIKDVSMGWPADGGGTASLSFVDDDVNDLGVAVVEFVYGEDGVTPLGDMTLAFDVLDGALNDPGGQSLAFAPQNKVWIEKNILVWSQDSTDTAKLEGIYQRYSQQQVPEPATALLVGLGLAGLASRRRKATA